MPPLAKPLTDTEVDKKSGPKKGTYRKADGNGLYLEIRPSGLKTWLVRARLPNGKQTAAITIGHYPEEVPITGMSLAQARVRALEIHRAAKLGLPIKGLNAQKQESRRLVAEQQADAMQSASDAERHTLKVVSTKWLAEKRPTWQPETYRKARLIVETYLIPQLGALDMRTLTTKDVKPALLEMAKKVPVLARKAKQHVGSIVGYAIDEGMRSDDAVLRLNNLLPKHEGGHIPAITESERELESLLKAIEHYDNRVVRAALKLAMLTAQRPGIVASARWSEMNLAAAEWNVPGKNPDGSNRMKTGKDFSTSLPTQALHVLEEMRLLTGGMEYVFPPLAQQRTPHLHRDSLGAALRNMGFRGKHSTHGFRATLRTVGRERLNFDIDVLEQQLAHAPKDQVEAAYARVKFKQQRREKMQEWADYLDSLRTVTISEE
ncbi:tyrosine-type recombinase/integrase [Dyella acidiphila]|uniref:Integrase arm-type DNA-binding domain-containing protein n=1 Tax=Dyella acidiphila TaxID=2775866 RepID=A0ABR9GFJ2_9GAMM|nr:integrase arm-type DNA-binding domain-containing protein [Dyella acidiphila]MBE1162802.1 integrase arm-type DNA-binding domain-containing protein [Dyella acidiphila]